MFHREAIARGCRLQGTGDEESLPIGETPKQRSALIAEAIQTMLDGSDEGDFTSDGKPNLIALNKRVGFNVTREERDAVWHEVTG
jgi:hypothetical protein